MWIITGIIINYLIGSIPTAYIFGRLLKGIDIRQYGSGNVGATNALRVLGKGAGITVLALDIVKGFLPLLFMGDFFASRSCLDPQIVYILLGVSCICGHNWTIFLHFKGGKGIATTLGMLLALAVKIPGLGLVIGLAVLVWAVTFIIHRIVSLSSIIAAIALPMLMILFKQQSIMITASIFLSAFTIYRHKSNIKRLMEGKEAKIKFK
ncbi:MAG: glycerol-3-phosphate 1-O-acyltransferase PlsY [Candidatus Omnitrophica bacterium]|nr:glycerol-3-phosphate 1-O-acyltransferase PlsY [Candidatus Omnitrophota bacterium]MDD5774835.1 glycerol-3-phosphate 1-O-acyltransferase PlsY [Candidatus Omnitrophota bacterium]